MSTNNPVTQNRIKVKGYRDRELKEVAIQTMIEALKLKISRPANNLTDSLLNTGGKDLIEASPKDSFRGIGCSMYSKKTEQKSLWGENHLGKCLMRVRQNLREGL